MSATEGQTSPAPVPEKLGSREKFSYGFGNLASCLYWQTFMVYLTIFYTDIFGISAERGENIADRVRPKGAPGSRGRGECCGVAGGLELP